jgi:L-fucose dehydrogenase
MDLQLENKVIIVTGGGRGIGAGIVHALAREGAIPIIVSRSAEHNLSTLEAIGGKGYQIALDLSNPNACQSAVTEALRLAGRIDGLVNNAGVNDGVGLENGNYAAFMDSLHKNLVHYYLMAHHALPALKATQGAILNISSKTAETGQGNTSAYAAANGGRNALTREWAVELLPYQIRVNAIVVAECMTPLYESWLKTLKDPETTLAKIKDKIPLGKRMTRQEEIADMAVFLLSARSSHTTGQIIHVDGGYVHLDRALL